MRSGIDGKLPREGSWTGKSKKGGLMGSAGAGWPEACQGEAPVQPFSEPRFTNVIVTNLRAMKK